MKKLILFIVCVLLSLNLTAQVNDSLSRYSIAELDSLFKIQKKPAEQLPYALAMLKKGEKEMEVNDTAFAKVLFKVGDTYQKLRDWPNATNYLEKAIAIWQEKMPLSPLHANCLQSQGTVYFYQEKYNYTELSWKKALEIRKIVFGEMHIEIASSFNGIGTLCIIKGDYKTAELNIKKAMEIIKHNLGEEQPNYASSINNLGLLYIDMGDYISAELCIEKSVEISKKVLGENHPKYASSLKSLAQLYRINGDFKSAEKYALQSLEIIRKNTGEEHPDYASNLDNLGVLYFDIGDYEISFKFNKQALELSGRIHGEAHSNYARILLHKGNLYYVREEYISAKRYYQQALEIKSKVYGKDHIENAIIMNNLGATYEHLRDFKSAEQYHLLALEIYRKVQGEEHYEYARSLNNLGIMYSKMGDYKTAEPYYKQAIEISKKALGEDHPDFISTQNSIAKFFLKTNREKEAYEILNQNFSKKAKQIADNFEWLNDNQKEAYWKQESSFFENLSLHANEASEKVPEFTGLNYNAALLTKSKMLEAKISSENYYREVDEIREELAYRRRLLAKMESEGTEDIEKLNLLKKEADSLDKRLTLSWPEYAAQKKNLSITWNQVQEKLNSDEAAIEFVRFYNEKDSNYYYNALVLRKNDKNPQLVKLCKEKDLTSIQPKSGFSAYYPLIWAPIEKYLQAVKTIYYSPVGEISNISLQAIYPSKEKGDKIIEKQGENRGNISKEKGSIAEKDAVFLMDRYKMHRLTSTRYLAIDLKQKENEQIGKSISLSGGINYDYLPGTDQSAEKGKSKNRSSESASGKLEFLLGTLTEVETINSTLSTKGWQTKLLKYNEALEEITIKQEAKEAPSILHIATHGYAFPEFNFMDSSISKNSLRYSFRFSKNPMVRSGIILAGGNWAWTGSDTLSKMGMEQNGILTALEVSQLNLRKTKLVVLSACETGLGKIEGSEGTFGLKRGFKLAGVEQIIVSLWSVPDKETMELMTLFYNDLSITLNPVSSFEKAQKEMRKKYPNEPEKWAGFVLVR